MLLVLGEEESGYDVDSECVYVEVTGALLANWRDNCGRTKRLVRAPACVRLVLAAALASDVASDALLDIFVGTIQQGQSEEVRRWWLINQDGKPSESAQTSLTKSSAPRHDFNRHSKRLCFQLKA